MSASSDVPEYGEKMKMNIAVSKFYAVGNDDESWTYERIANYLDESVPTVKQYIHNTAFGQEVEAIAVEAESQARLKVYTSLMQKLENLQEIEQTLLQTKEAIPSSYKMSRARAEVTFDQVPNVGRLYENGTVLDIDVPIPDDYVESPNIDKLKVVWREQRMVIEQIESFFGMRDNTDDSQTNENVIYVKNWSSDDIDQNLPDREVIDVESGNREEITEKSDARDNE